MLCVQTVPERFTESYLEIKEFSECCSKSECCVHAQKAQSWACDQCSCEDMTGFTGPTVNDMCNSSVTEHACFTEVVWSFCLQYPREVQTKLCKVISSFFCRKHFLLLIFANISVLTEINPTSS